MGTGDVIIIQGSGFPVLFIPSALTATLFETPDQAAAAVITNVGAAAIETLVAGNASFESTSVITESNVIESVVLRFELPNGLKVAYTTDEDRCAQRALFEAEGIDLVVTDTAVDWNRQHAPFIGEIVAHVSAMPPQLVGLQHLGLHQLSTLVREAISRAAIQNKTEGES